jgi:GNAT superfamily N-acetyltransferase
MPRLAHPNDLVGLSALYRELRPNDPVIHGPVFQSALAQLVTNPAVRLVVQEEDGVLVSTCMLGIVPSLAHGARPFGVIEHVVTLASHRRRGFSRAVIEATLDMAWAADCYKVLLLSGASLHAAHALYETIGFHGDVERGFVIKAPADGHSRPDA